MNVLATANGRARRGYAEALKREVLDLARAADVGVVRSSVHRDNEAVLNLNRKLKATITPDPDDRSYLSCEIEVSGS